MRALYRNVRASRSAKRAALGKDEGFTLIELMVVVLIIAILIAVAVPTFLGARKSAQNSAAAQLLRNVVQTGRDVYTTNNSFGTPTAPVNAGFTSAEPSYTFGFATTSGTIAAASTVAGNFNSVGVAFGTGNNSTGMIQSAEYAVETSGGLCLYALDVPSDQSALVGATSGVPTAGVYYSSKTATKGVCTINQEGTAPGAAWSQTPLAS